MIQLKKHCSHLTHLLWLDSDIMIQLDSEFMIQLYSNNNTILLIILRVIDIDSFWQRKVILFIILEALG